MIEVSIHYPIGRRIDEPNTDKVRLEFVRPKKPFLFWGTCEEVAEIQYPKGYGVAHYDHNTCRILFAPMPFNIVVGWLIWSWEWLRVGCTIWYHRHRHKTYKDARQEMEGRVEWVRAQAKAEGVNEGLRKGQDWFHYLLDNRHATDEELKAKRKELGI